MPKTCRISVMARIPEMPGAPKQPRTWRSSIDPVLLNQHQRRLIALRSAELHGGDTLLRRIIGALFTKVGA
jgi:hypothetical protein